MSAKSTVFEHPHDALVSSPRPKPLAAHAQRKGRVSRTPSCAARWRRLEHHAEAALVRRHEDAARRRIHHVVADADLAQPRPLEPAIERSVVVLPQPLGPSSVKSLPGGTSKPTSLAARIACRARRCSRCRALLS